MWLRSIPDRVRLVIFRDIAAGMDDVDDLDRVGGIAEKDDVVTVRCAPQTEAKIASIRTKSGVQASNMETFLSQLVGKSGCDPSDRRHLSDTIQSLRYLLARYRYKPDASAAGLPRLGSALVPGLLKVATHILVAVRPAARNRRIDRRAQVLQLAFTVFEQAKTFFDNDVGGRISTIGHSATKKHLMLSFDRNFHV